MACGCGDRCTCSVVAGSGVTVTGSGDPSDPFVITSLEAVFSALSAGNTITITPGGDAGHSPNLDVNISPNAGNALENAGNGLFVGPTALVNAVFPVGMSIELTHDNALPSGFLDEDGAEYLVASYPSLAASYGATGVGDGLWDNHPQFGLPAAGNFRVPDSQTRAVYNVGTGFAVGDSDAVALASRTPSHVHTGPSHSHGPGTLTGITAATTAAAALSVGDGSLQQFGVNDNIAGGTAWLNVTTGTPAAPPATPTNNPSVDGEGPGSSGDVALSDHSHGIAAVGVTVNGGTTAAAGTGNTGTKSPGHIIYRRAVFAGV